MKHIRIILMKYTSCNKNINNEKCRGYRMSDVSINSGYDTAI